MIKYCRDKWGQNCDKLERFFRQTDCFGECSSYRDILMHTIKYILDDGKSLDELDYEDWDYTKIHQINDGEYQGTLMFLILRADQYQPAEYDYILTYINYGSCSVCDTLQSIQSDYDSAETEADKEEVIKDLMKLSCDLVNNIIVPYNHGWRERQEYKQVKWKENSNADFIGYSC